MLRCGYQIARDAIGVVGFARNDMPAKLLIEHRRPAADLALAVLRNKLVGVDIVLPPREQGQPPGRKLR